MFLTLHSWTDRQESCARAERLESEEIQVWLVPVACSPMELDRLLLLLNGEERRRAQRFAVAMPRRQYITGRAVLRQLLGASLRVEPDALRFECRRNGKPCLASPPQSTGLRFNLSHSEDWVAIALARGWELGIDLEAVRLLEDWRPLAPRVLAPAEQEQVDALPSARQPEAFCRIWTRKEACLKATGEGLRDDLPEIEVSVAPEEPRVLRWPGLRRVRDMSLYNLPAPPGFVGTVALACGLASCQFMPDSVNQV